MANLFEQRERRVIPNWRRYSSTSELSELSFAPNDDEGGPKRILLIADYKEAWDRSKTPAIAGDLLSAAFVNGFMDDEVVRNAATYLIKAGNRATSAQMNLANLVLRTVKSTADQPSSEETAGKFSSDRYYGEIRHLRQLINEHPYNSILYVEISRIYAILGLELKSIRNMLMALSLAPTNRFILRAAVRLFVHYDKASYIHNILRKSPLLTIDPWITSAEIALATIRQKESLHIRHGIRMIESGRYSWHSLTELASSVGTVEYLSGNKKKAINLLKKALLSPNDNTLAQIAWINSKIPLLETNPRNYQVQNTYEALALNDYFNRSFESALNSCKSWFLDMPFSKHPITFGAHIAGALLDDYDESIRLLKTGLISHPGDPQIINNIAYSYALQNKISEAESYLSQIDESYSIHPDSRICLTATRGLIRFRKGDTEGGSAHYREAIKSARLHKNAYLGWLASLNYAREIVIGLGSEMDIVENLISKVPDNPFFPDLLKLKAEVINLLGRCKKGKSK